MKAWLEANKKYEAIRALTSTPPGMVCVPVEPSEARIRAGALAILGRSPKHLGYQEMALAAYRAFISHGGKEATGTETN